MPWIVKNYTLASVPQTKTEVTLKIRTLEDFFHTNKEHCGNQRQVAFLDSRSFNSTDNEASERSVHRDVCFDIAIPVDWADGSLRSRGTGMGGWVASKPLVIKRFLRNLWAV